MRHYNSTSKESSPFTSSAWTLLWLLSAKVSATGLSLWSLFSYWMKNWITSLLLSRTTNKLGCLLAKNSNWIGDPIVLGLKRTVLWNSRVVRDKTSNQYWSYWSALLQKLAKDFPGSTEVSSSSVLFSDWIQNISRIELISSSQLFKCISPNLNYFTMAYSFMRLSKSTSKESLPYTSSAWTLIWILSISESINTFSFLAVSCHHLPGSRFLQVSDW